MYLRQRVWILPQSQLYSDRSLNCSVNHKLTPDLSINLVYVMLSLILALTLALTQNRTVTLILTYRGPPGIYIYTCRVCVIGPLHLLMVVHHDAY